MKTNKQKLKNYTTTIPAQQTIMEIQNLLMKSGAIGIAMETEDGQIKSLFFKLKVNDREVPFKLPARPERVHSTLFSGMSGNYRYGEARKEKSTNIAWRIVKDWLEVQLSLIELDMAKPAEIFFPYLLVGATKTLYEQAEEGGFDKLLPSGD